MKKRVFRQVGGQMAFRKWKEWEAGDWLEGTFLRVEFDRKYKKNTYVVEVTDCGFGDTQACASFKAKKICKLNSTGILDKAFEKITEGEYVRIDYNGTDTIQSGEFEGTEAHSMTISVAQWEEDTVLSPDEGESDL